MPALPMPTRLPLSVLCAAVLLAAGCRLGPDAEPRRFAPLPASATGVDFVNALPDDDPDFNIINYLYYYDGGGVAVGDVNNDSLPDLYFTANRGPNRLYLNRGGLRFEDVTDRAGVAGTGNWTTGVTMADVNGDGWLDLYVCAVGGTLGRDGRNQLYLNNGDGTFTEQAAAYGLDFAGYATHAAFFDYDRDGDLDVYLLNHSLHTERTYGRAYLRQVRHPRAGDRLYRNDPDTTGRGTRRFTDVSEAAGIYGGVVGYGLGVAVSDVDLNGCPDLYVANDFHENDYLYYNQCDGTFTEALRAAMPHTSRSSMGVDAADFNNDGRPDLAVLDMLPDDEAIRKTAVGAEPYDIYQIKVRFGYHHQLSRNTLQLNRGAGRFSDIAPLAGVEATDWSWAPLFADLDNDGYKDLFVTNGIYRRPNDLDVISRFEGGPAEMQDARARSAGQGDHDLIAAMPQVALPNYAFRNNGDLTFTDQAAAWGLDDPGFANGAAYADLDNDGDLDLVTNNVNEPARLYENHTDRMADGHFLRVVLQGEAPNTAGIGAKVLLRHDGRLQMQELYPSRGFQSSVDPRLHFGLGTAPRVDTLVVVWPDARYQLLTDVAAGRTLHLRQADATGPFRHAPPASGAALFAAVTETLALDYTHRENSFNDFNREPLMPRMVSMEGPALAVGDVDGDGRDDLFAGGAKRQAARLFVRRPDGGFRATNTALWQADSLHEDVDAAFFDADGDGDRDLIVVSGGNEFWGEAEALRSRLYLNDGRGGFSRAADALPPLYLHGAVAAPGDYDGDGDLDLFLGGRVVARRYGEVPRSYLLQNDGRGRFTDVTAEVAPELARAGLVTDATWADVDGDGGLDLVVVGAWMPLRLFLHRAGRLTDATAGSGLAEATGWWNSVVAADLDDDGDQDLVAGNLGLNSLIRARPDAPARLYLHDFDEDGRLDPLLTTIRHGARYPFATIEMLRAGLPGRMAAYATHADFGARPIDAFLSEADLAAARVLEAATFASSYALNHGDGTFTLQALPVEAQFAPVYALLPDDVDGDGHLDLLLAGNFTGVEPHVGRHDAGYGLVLRGDGRGTFRAVDLEASRLVIDGEVRALRYLDGPGGRLLVAARNNDRLQLFRVVR